MVEISKKIMLASLHILTGNSQKLVTCLLRSEWKASVLNGNRGDSSFRVLKTLIHWLKWIVEKKKDVFPTTKSLTTQVKVTLFYNDNMVFD